MSIPEKIVVDGAAQTVTLHWPAPHPRRQQLANVTLRNACPCAMCRRQRLSSSFVCAPATIAITDIRSMAYGIQIVFSDGHDRGIFPWTLLQSLG